MKKSILVLSSMIFLLTACKKNTSTLAGGCRCVSYTSNTDSSASTFNWGQNGMMVSGFIALSSTGYNISVTYFSGGFRTDSYYLFDSTAHYYATYTLNAQGYIAKAVTTYTGSNAPDSITYQYNSSGYLVQKTVSAGSGSYTGTYTWSNGNLITYTTPGTTTAYQYYTNEPYNGDPKNLFEKYYGVMSANPVKRTDMVSGSSTTTDLYDYELDGSNNIIEESDINNDGGLTTYNYTYQCN